MAWSISVVFSLSVWQYFKMSNNLLKPLSQLKSNSISVCRIGEQMFIQIVLDTITATPMYDKKLLMPESLYLLNLFDLIWH